MVPFSFFFVTSGICLKLKIGIKLRNEQFMDTDPLWRAYLVVTWKHKHTPCVSGSVLEGRTLGHFWGENGENSAGLQIMFSSSKTKPRDACCALSATKKEKIGIDPLHYTHLHFLFLLQTLSFRRAGELPFIATCPALNTALSTEV